MWILFLPWLLGVLSIMVVASAAKRWWKTALALVMTMMLLKARIESFKPNQKAESELKVLTWNIHGGDGDTLRYKTIAKRILAEGADIVYVAECFMETSAIIDELLRKRYPYTSYSKDNMLIHYGHHIFSKCPIKYLDVIEVEGGNERIIISRIDIHGVDIDVYGCHLTNNNYNESAMGQQNVARINDSHSLWNYVKGIETASV